MKDVGFPHERKVWKPRKTTTVWNKAATCVHEHTTTTQTHKYTHTHIHTQIHTHTLSPQNTAEDAGLSIIHSPNSPAHALIGRHKHTPSCANAHAQDATRFSLALPLNFQFKLIHTGRRRTHSHTHTRANAHSPNTHNAQHTPSHKHTNAKTLTIKHSYTRARAPRAGLPARGRRTLAR